MAAQRLFILADYPWGVDCTRFLVERGEEIVGCALLAPENEGSLNTGCSDTLRSVLKLPSENVIAASDIANGTAISRIQKMNPDVIISLFWSQLLSSQFLTLAKNAINIHLSYLPYNRGANPNVWAIVDGTPAGVTMHHMNEGADTGDIIAQAEISIESIDTGETLYKKLNTAAVQLFKDTWPSIADGSAPRSPQAQGGTAHLRRDYETLDEIELDDPTTARKLINHLRAKTFPPFPGAYFKDEKGKRVQIRIELSYRDHEEKE